MRLAPGTKLARYDGLPKVLVPKLQPVPDIGSRHLRPALLQKKVRQIRDKRRSACHTMQEQEPHFNTVTLDRHCFVC